MIKTVSVSRFPYYQRPFSFGVRPTEVSLPLARQIPGKPSVYALRFTERRSNDALSDPA